MACATVSDYFNGGIGSVLFNFQFERSPSEMPGIRNVSAPKFISFANVDDQRAALDCGDGFLDRYLSDPRTCLRG
jgi:hypothetical protein